MTDPDPIDLMRELVAIQTARAANWLTPDSPADAELEGQHSARISQIQEQLSARRVAESETKPTGAVKDRGVGTAPVGNIFRRILRCILPRLTQTKHKKLI